MTKATTQPTTNTPEITPELLDTEQMTELLTLAQTQLKQQWESLLAEYPSQCVAMFSYGRYFVAPDAASLEQLVLESGFDPAKAAIRWLYPHLKPGRSFGRGKTEPMAQAL
jgi:hypothetical protein